MNALAKLVALKGNGKEQRESNLSIASNHIDDTYYQSGYDSALEANGDSIVFNRCLDDVFEKFKEKCRLNDQEQMKLNAPYVDEMARQRSELNGRETLKSIKEDDLQCITTSMETIDNDVATVRSDPEKYGIEATKRPKAQFFIGLVILLPITLYLLVFYISASYSAFFKTFDTSQVIAAIFDANALQKAISDGWLEAIFVSTIPFAFMGLGYLVHMFQKDRKFGKLKIAALFIVTFIFDSILAYQIEKKIYDFDKTLTSPPFDLQIAFSSVEFWGIIFAGFVVYIIWGLVFDFVMKEYENIDKIRVYINKLKEEKQNLLLRKEQVTNAINELLQEITKITSTIAELQTKIDGFIFPNRKYLLYHAEYVKGWYMAISSEIAMSHDNKKALIRECEKAASGHLLKHEVSTDGAENIVYTKNTIN